MTEVLTLRWGRVSHHSCAPRQRDVWEDYGSILRVERAIFDGPLDWVGDKEPPECGGKEAWDCMKISGAERRRKP